MGMNLDDAEDFDRSENACRRFAFTYTFDGLAWLGEVYAATFEEAEMKVKAMAKGKVQGEIVAEYGEDQ